MKYLKCENCERDFPTTDKFELATKKLTEDEQNVIITAVCCGFKNGIKDERMDGVMEKVDFTVKE